MKYAKSNNNDFFNGLRYEADRFFKQTQSSKKGNAFLFLKGSLLILIYFGAYAVIYRADISLSALILAYVLMGLSGVMIVFNLVHDASHKAVSSKPWVNTALTYLGDLVGINTYIWDIRHNIQHHSFTNVLGGDLIIENVPLLRLSKHQTYKPFHRFQPYYALFLYMGYSFYWMFIIDFKLFFRKDICNLINIKHPTREWVILIISKLFYITYMVVFPWLFTSMSLLQAVLFFLLMHMAAGLLLSTIAVLGHFVEGPAFPQDENGVIDNSWSEHELAATIDFAPKSQLVNWVTGGLNTHVAHHLFPSVCHVHYYGLTKVIADYCQSKGFNYQSETFLGGIRSHFRYLHRLSKPAA